jgi:hypothetical protein
MRAREFIREDVTDSGSIASIAVPLGAPIKRIFDNNDNKYVNSLKKPAKQKEKHARG